MPISHTYKKSGQSIVLKETVIRSCQYLLMPVVRFLLKQGVTWDEFGELSKDAFVTVARADYGVQGRPTNNARVALLTGLSRREVARVRDRLMDAKDDARDLQGNRISQILAAWHVDDEFAENGRPKDLSLADQSGSLSSLLKKYAGDLPHGAIRKEMQQRGLLQELESGHLRVLKRDYIYSEVDPEIVRRMGAALHDHAATLEHNLNEKRLSAPRFEAIADNLNISPKVFREFQNLVETRGLSFLEDIDGWLSTNEIDHEENANAHAARMGVGVYLFYDENELGQLK